MGHAECFLVAGQSVLTAAPPFTCTLMYRVPNLVGNSAETNSWDAARNYDLAEPSTLQDRVPVRQYRKLCGSRQSHEVARVRRRGLLVRTKIEGVLGKGQIIDLRTWNLDDEKDRNATKDEGQNSQGHPHSLNGYECTQQEYPYP